MDPEDKINPDVVLVKRYSDLLGEHFDSVQIFATRHESEIEDGTITISLGTGNWFARYGQVKEWMIKKDEETRSKVRDENE